ncbi:MAG: NAD(P)H-dependent oxidoreductase subunit E [Hydrogenothermaceae bacterium]
MEFIYLTEEIKQQIDRYVEKFPLKDQAIIQSLHLIYSKYRDIEDVHMKELSEYLQVPLNVIEGIVSFYDMFRVKRGARHHIRVCKNLPCHIMGCKNLLKMFEKLTGEKANQYSKNGRFYIETVECIGSCSIAPAFMIDDDLYEGLNITEEKLNEILSKYT